MAFGKHFIIFTLILVLFGGFLFSATKAQIDCRDFRIIFEPESSKIAVTANGTCRDYYAAFRVYKNGKKVVDNWRWDFEQIFADQWEAKLQPFSIEPGEYTIVVDVWNRLSGTYQTLQKSFSYDNPPSLPSAQTPPTSSEVSLTQIINCEAYGGGIGGCFQALYNLGVQVAVALAFLMIIIGGFEYMFSGTIPGKLRGKERIIDAIIGLVIIFLSGTVLYWINPDIFKATLNLPEIKITLPEAKEGDEATGEGCENCVKVNDLNLNNLSGKSNDEEVSQSIVNYLQIVAQNLQFPAEITAGYNPSGPSVSSCHKEFGTCIDIVPKDRSNCNAWSSLGNALAQAGANKILFEYESEPNKVCNDILCNSSDQKPWQCFLNPNASGVHFHAEF